MKENKLRARWSKREKDIVVTYPRGIQTVCDCNYLFSNVFNDDFVEEIKARGYDITTLKFEIKVDEKGERFEKKFPSLSKELEA
ncbi:hypothetical protein ACSW8S_18695 (plasmid) [Clostridium perfringens]